MVKKKRVSGWAIFFKVLLFIIKIPYFIGLGIYKLVKKTREHTEKISVERKRAEKDANYQDFEIVERKNGNFGAWEKSIASSESKIGIIVGARGSGKTAFGLSLLENVYAKKKSKIFAMGFKKEEMPSWIEVIESVSEIKNNSFILVDEGGILFSSRRAMSNPNKLLSELILIARHKSLNILFISQNSSNLDVNALRQADYLILKKPALLQMNFERKIIKDIYNEVGAGFKKHEKFKGISYVYSDSFRGFVNNPLPSFWNVRISKSFSDK